MKGIPKISEAEWMVMRVLWGRSPLTANQTPQCPDKFVDVLSAAPRGSVHRRFKPRREADSSFWFSSPGNRPAIRSTPA